MLDNRRLMKRPFLCVLSVILFAAMSQATPATTTISDVIYRADGTPASGVLIISWPAFSTSAGAAVGAGTQTVTLGPGGALAVSLIPNLGATPASTLYTVVYQLDDGVVKTEYWTVPATSPTTVAGVRTTLGANTSASSLATKQYVDFAIATKAVDSSVVHVSGNETIAGLKEFSLAPSVPTPVQATDAVNKAYVDNALSTVGAGSYVSKTGDTMSGPLLLSGDPGVPNEAATRHFVDLGMAGKADIVNGVVPAGQLGGGTADATKCLLGNNTWGPCGGSGNAVSIQSVPVAAQAPTDGQVITYEASSSSYKPKAGGGLSAGMQVRKYASDFMWTQSSSSDLTVAGAKTVNLSSCPAGVTGTEPAYYVYVSGTGTPEAVKVTGGTCSGTGQAGTLQFTTTSAHAAGYTIGSASSGLQEALIAARVLPSGATSTQAGYVVAPPGDFNVYASVSVRSNNQTVDFSGSVLQCYTNTSAPCLYIGDAANSNLVLDVTILNPRGRPMLAGTAANEKPFIEVNAQKTRLFNVATRAYGVTGAFFSTYVQVDDDQAFLLDGLDTSLGANSGNRSVRCDASACNPVVYAPGPFNVYSAVGWLKNLNISMQGFGNGVDWQSGNTLRITDSVIQGYAQYGVRGGNARGGYGNIELENVYEESGCADPLGNLGCTGLIEQGNVARIHGGEAPVGSFPQFANTGSTDVRYYLVPRSSLGVGNPLYAGKALTNGSGNITVLTHDIAGATSFDLLKVPAPAGGTMEVAPSAEVCDGLSGHGKCAVLTNVTRASACVNGVCTFVDPQGTSSAYTVTQPPTYFPLLTLWPGSLVLSSNQDTGNAQAGPALAKLDSVVSGMVSVMGTYTTSVQADRCSAASSYTTMLVSCLDSWSTHVPYVATFIPSQSPGGYASTGAKGRINMGAASTNTHLITLNDSNAAKTGATQGGRPSNDANDAFIGIDHSGVPTAAGIAFGAPYSLTNYIGNKGDGTNWLEQLTASAKTFKVPVTISSSLSVTGNTTLQNVTINGTCTGSGCGGGGSFTAGGDLTGSSTTQTVAGILGRLLPSLSTGYLQWNGTAWVFSNPSGTVSWPLQSSSDGSGTAPVYSFTSEPTLGFYRYGAGIIGISNNNNLRFNRLISSSSNAPTSGGSILLGVSDAVKAYFSTSDQTCGTTPCINLIAGAADGTGRAKVGDHYGVLLTGPITTTGINGVTDTTMVTNLNANLVGGLSASALEQVVNKGVANGYASLDATGKVPSSQLPSAGGAVSSVFGRTGIVTAAAGDYNFNQLVGALTSTQDYTTGVVANTYPKVTVNLQGRVTAGAALAATDIPPIAESGVTNLTSDLAGKLSSSGPQTFNGDLTVSGTVYANTFQSTSSGPWSVEGGFGTLSTAGANKSKLGFGANGKLSVSENSGAVTEVAKKLPQQFTYTFFDPNNPLSMSLQVPSVYVNRAAAMHVTEVYCEIDTGTASINLQNSGANILSSDLACSTSGATSTSFASGKDAIPVGTKINHVTTALGTGLHRINVVVRYTID